MRLTVRVFAQLPSSGRARVADPNDREAREPRPDQCHEAAASPRQAHQARLAQRCGPWTAATAWAGGSL